MGRGGSEDAQEYAGKWPGLLGDAWPCVLLTFNSARRELPAASTAPNKNLSHERRVGDARRLVL